MAWLSLRNRLLNIDVPIAAGLAALAGRSLYLVLSGTGDGYFDSLTGLIFFLLCGRLFQQKSYDRLAFDRDFKSFFPLSIRRRRGREETPVALSQLEVGDELVIRNGELVPADARLVEGEAMIDYSFVTGESAPVERRAGDYLYAGGRQVGGALAVQTVKAVSQSYLTSLWNQEAFRKENRQSLASLTNRFSRWFTGGVFAVAIGAAFFWGWRDSDRAFNAFVAILIVACPCALALAAPFALGTAQRVLGRQNVFLKNPDVLETLARVNAVVFDKTGTLTASGVGDVRFQGDPLSPAETAMVQSMTRHSSHPLALRIRDSLAEPETEWPAVSFLETAGSGMEGRVAGVEIWMGSADWLASRAVRVAPGTERARVHLALNGRYRGSFCFEHDLRPRAGRLLRNLSARFPLALLSGDHARERAIFGDLFGSAASLHFNQSPLDKLAFVRRLQGQDRTVMMVGDGLNDAGALRQSDVGVAVVERVGAFTPASDVIMGAEMIPALDEVMRFARRAVGVVRLSFVISALYNGVGIAIAAQGRLSPVICAILMPLSSVTVVAIGCGLTGWLGRGLSVAAVGKERLS